MNKPDVYGLKGLQELLNCSKFTAQKIKNSGKIPFISVGKKLAFNSEEVLQALTTKAKEGLPNAN
ncbi:DUF3853 family protein [Pedobacter glucosidilyticus]|uniref:DUF3853 family protein n=1 Tax=Pedobacter glucosidilyticus TaxID=1122941 RepID=UPI000563E2E4|nr:DUF3853 family protein [Pedobacter glucosidilyticus]